MQVNAPKFNRRTEEQGPQHLQKYMIQPATVRKMEEQKKVRDIDKAYGKQLMVETYKYGKDKGKTSKARETLQHVNHDKRIK